VFVGGYRVPSLISGEWQWLPSGLGDVSSSGHIPKAYQPIPCYSHSFLPITMGTWPSFHDIQRPDRITLRRRTIISTGQIESAPYSSTSSGMYTAIRQRMTTYVDSISTSILQQLHNDTLSSTRWCSNDERREFDDGTLRMGDLLSGTATIARGGGHGWSLKNVLWWAKSFHYRYANNTYRSGPSLA
jgi:hypothetical protein